jgi:hypothetical protein
MIAITSIIKNREWILNEYLEAILNIDFSKENLYLIFLDDSSIDKSLEILNQFEKYHEHKYAGIYILPTNINFDNNFSSRDSKDRQKLYSHLARLRNIMIDIINYLGCHYQLSIDSDILVLPDILTYLLSFNKRYIASMVLNDNSKEIRKFDYDNLKNRYINAAYKIDDKYIHFKTYDIGNTYEVDCSGACYLVNYEILNEKTNRFEYHKFGEDAGYCENIKMNGCEIFINTTVKSIHVMDKENKIEALKVFNNYGRYNFQD